MIVQGHVVAVIAERSGTSESTGNQWRRQDFVLEYQEQGAMSYDKVLLTLRDGNIDALALKVGDLLQCAFVNTAHEYNGRWFAGTRLLNATKLAPAVPGVNTEDNNTVMPEPKEPEPAAPSEPETDKKDDLPF